MAWAICTRNIPYLHSFAAAESFWNETPLWKNKHPSWRPLDGLRMEHKRLIKNSYGGYECVLYNTALVTYYPDSVELQLDSRSSSSAFVRCVKPDGIKMTSANNTLFWEVDTPEGIRYYTGSNKLKFSAQSKGLWKLDGSPDPVREQVYEPKLGAQTRKLLKPYTVWYKTSKRLGVILEKKYWYLDRNALQILIDTPDNSADFYELSQRIGSPDAALKAAYKLTGAHSFAPVSPDRLPRRTAS